MNGQDTQAELRALWKAHRWLIRNGYERPYPDVLRGLNCGAKTRKGTPCKKKALHNSGRCKLHGGLSTGPK